MREEILEAIGNIDTDLIERVESLRKNPKKRINLRRLTLIAACVCVTVLISIAVLNKYHSDNTIANDEDFADGGSMIPDGVKHAKIRITETNDYGFFGTVIESESLIDGTMVYVTGINEIGFDMQNSILNTVIVSYIEIGGDEGDDADKDSIQTYTIKAISIEKGE